MSAQSRSNNPDHQPPLLSRSRGRRSNGEGTIYQRSDGRWAAALYVEGKRRYFYGRTKKEAETKRRAAILALEKGEFATEGDARQTVAQYFAYWIGVKRAEGLRESTYVTYRKIEKTIAPYIGRIQLRKLTPAHMQALYAQLQKRGLTQSTLKTVHTVFKATLNDAVKWRYISASPLQHIPAPRVSEREYRILAPDQAADLMYAARGSQLECAIILTVTLGLRRGELLALRWSDIDLDAKKLQVKHNVSYLTVDGVTDFYEGAPKTKAGRRTLRLPDIVIESLRAHSARQLEARLKARTVWQDKDLVFTSPKKPGEFLTPAALLYRFQQALKAAILPPMRWHELRHSAASILLSIGVPIKVVQEILGHANVNVTLSVYGHVLPGLQEKAMEQVDDLYKDRWRQEGAQ
jgi:integrase